MGRKAVHLAAAIAESLRFAVVAFLAFDVGALYDPMALRLISYVAAPQLLFAAGFFFMWLDSARYSAYRPLLTIGKAASVACFVPLAARMVVDLGGSKVASGIQATALALAFVVAAVDIASISILLLVSDASRGPAPDALGPQKREQDTIEQVEV